MLPRPLATAITVLVAIMWAANLIVGYLYPGRSDPAVNAIFAIVAGAIWGLQRRAQRAADPDQKQNNRGDLP